MFSRYVSAIQLLTTMFLSPQDSMCYVILKMVVSYFSGIIFLGKEFGIQVEVGCQSGCGNASTI